MNTDTAEKAIDEKFCSECGSAIIARVEICPRCGSRQALRALGDQQIAGIRFVLAAVAFLIICWDPSETNHLASAYAALIIYALYSASIYFLARHVETFSKRSSTLLVLADVVLFSLLASLSGGTNSIFCFFYFFAIVVACSRLGDSAGERVTFISALLFISAGFITTPYRSIDWDRFVFRSITLIAFGNVVSYWAGAEIRLQRKLELLREVSLIANPRFGVDRTTSHFMRCVLEFFKADTCVFLEYDRETQRHQLRRATSGDPEGGFLVIPASNDIADLAGALTNAGVELYTGGRRFWKRSPEYRVYDPATHVITPRKVEEASAISEWLGGQSFVVSPLRHHEWSRGYLFLTASRPAAFGIEDAIFLLQLADQVTPILQHIRLVDHLASDAADEERRRIARSVHDRVIQPYIGLQLGLKAVHQLVRSAARANAPDMGDETFQRAVAAIEHLRSMASEGVEELRQYVYGLRSAKARGDVLVDALLRYAAKFETATGIRVIVIDRLNGMDLKDRLGAEIFQIAAEALSNVHRHTTATEVTLSMHGGPDGSVVVRVENEGRGDEKNGDFVPRSIFEHAEALGGRAGISNANGRTIVQMEIPL